MSSSENDTLPFIDVLYSVEHHESHTHSNHGFFLNKQDAQERLDEILISGNYPKNDWIYFTIEEYYWDKELKGFIY
jgi:hypothetical protein